MRRAFHQALAAVALAAAAACASSAGGSGVAGDRGPDVAPRVYVANQESATVTVLDAETREVVATVDLVELGFAETAKPHDVAVAPDGSRWYVSLIGENRILAFDRDDALVGQVETPVPGLLAMAPDGSLWAGRSMAAVNPPSTIVRVDPDAMEIVEEIDVVFPRPHALAVSPDGAWVYVASLAENRFASIEVATVRVRLVDVPGDMIHTLVDFAVSPDGRWLVAGGEMSGAFLVWDRTDPAAPNLTKTIELGGAPWHPLFTPDGRFVVVPRNRADAVTIVDAASWKVAGMVEGDALARPHGSAPGPEGVVFVSGRNTDGTYEAPGDDPRAGTVTAIDPETREILSTAVAGRYAAGMGAAGR